jgi:hypothetical protein
MNKKLLDSPFFSDLNNALQARKVFVSHNYYIVVIFTIRLFADYFLKPQRVHKGVLIRRSVGNQSAPFRWPGHSSFVK